MTERYRLVFHGEFRPGHNPSDVITQLADLLQMPRLRVNALIARTPAIIRRDLDLSAAKQFYFELSEIGFLTMLEEDTAPPAAPTSTWDGVERRMGERRSSEDRRQGNRDSKKGSDRRQNDRRKSTTPPPESS